MLSFPVIDPVAISLGPVKVHWYGIMYLVGFLAAWWLARLRSRRADSPLREQQVSDLIFYGALGVVLGGRIGYMVFYNSDQLMADPLSLFAVWQGGMSFHGGLIGVMLSLWLYGRKLGLSFFQVMDFTAPLVPIGLGAGRLGNFIGGELWGRVTELPWGMIFPNGGPLPRHPSQLYQFALEGVALFCILWWFSAKPRPRGQVSAIFLLGYGTFRFLVEFVRQPDQHIGFIAFGWLTEGQLLSLPMILIGLVIFFWASRSEKTG